MKKIFLVIALIGGFMISQAQTKAPNEKQAVNGPKMEFKTLLWIMVLLSIILI